MRLIKNYSTLQAQLPRLHREIYRTAKIQGYVSYIGKTFLVATVIMKLWHSKSDAAETVIESLVHSTIRSSMARRNHLQAPLTLGIISANIGHTNRNVAQPRDIG